MRTFDVTTLSYASHFNLARHPCGMADGFELGLGQEIPSLLCGGKQVVVIIEYAVAQVVAFEVRPHPFDRVELWAVRRQVKQRHIGRYLQCFGNMPTRLIHHQHDVLVLAGLFADEAKMCVHVIGIDGRRQQSRRFTGQRIDRREKIQPFIFGLFYGRRARPFVRPDGG